MEQFSKFQVGDIVRVKDNFWKIEPKCDNPGFNGDMKKFAGKEYVIHHLWNNTSSAYELENTGWIWHEDWLDLVEDNTPDVTEEELFDMFK